MYQSMIKWNLNLDLFNEYIMALRGLPLKNRRQMSKKNTQKGFNFFPKNRFR